MNALVAWFGSETGQALLLALGHSLWVAVIICVAASLGASFIPARYARLRYGFFLSAQALLVVATLVIWSLLDDSAGKAPMSDVAVPAQAESRATTDFTADEAGAVTGEVIQAPSPDGISSAASTAVGSDWLARTGLVWLAGALLILLARCWAMGRTHWYCRSGVPVEESRWLEFLDFERARLGISRVVSLRALEGLAVPAAYGLFRPVILIPASWVTGLSEATIRAILVHELSHLRQLDPLVQAFQQVVEALFFFNPCVWLLSRQIGLEREACCDRAVAERVDPAAYAQWLLDLNRGEPVAMQPALAASGDGRRPSLSERIRRLLRPGERAGARFSLKLMLPVLAVALLTLFLARQAADAAVAAVAEMNWVQKVEAVLAFDRGEHSSAEWVRGDSMQLTGTLLSETGEPVPGATIRVKLYAADGQQRMSTSIRVDEANGTFARDVELIDYSEDRPFVRFVMVALAPGFVPVELERMPTQKGELSFNIEMSPGEPVEILVQDVAGEPIPDAQIKVDYVAIGQNLNAEYRTDIDGIATIPVPLGYALRLSVQAKGFQSLKNAVREFTKPGERQALTLDAGVPVRGVVYDRETGEPLAGVGLFLLQSLAASGDASHGYGFWVGDDDPDALTAEDGSFELRSLDAGSYHWLAIQKEGYLVGFSGAGDSRQSRNLQAEFALKPGAEPVRIGLIPQRPVDVTIKLPSEMETVPGEKDWIHYSHQYSVGILGLRSHSHGSWIQRRKPEYGEGEVRFQITPTMAAPISIGLGHTRGASEIIEGWTYDQPILVDLSDQPASMIEAITYEIKLDLPAGAPAPQGQLLVRYVDGGYVGQYKRVPVENERATFTVEQRLDRGIHLSSEELIGYYFKKVSIPAIGTLPETSPVSAVRYTVEDLVPAGALRVRLKNLSPDLETTVWVMRSPPFWKWGAKPVDLWLGESFFTLAPGESEIVLSPVPFDTAIQLQIRNAGMIFDSDSISVDEDDAIAEASFTLPAGEVVGGRVVDQAGQPLADEVVRLNRVHELTRSGYRTNHFETRTDADGRFAFGRVNFDLKGIYYLHVEGTVRTADFKQIIKQADGNMRLEPGVTSPLRVRFLHGGTGEPLAGYAIEAHEANVAHSRRFLKHSILTAPATDADGWTKIYGLPEEGRYFFRVWIPSGANSRSAAGAEAELPASSNGVRELTLRVPASR